MFAKYYKYIQYRNLVTIWSLVWNHYSTYYVLSQVALLISCNHTFHGKPKLKTFEIKFLNKFQFLVCLHPNYLFSILTIGCAYGVQLSVAHWLKDL